MQRRSSGRRTAAAVRGRAVIGALALGVCLAMSGTAMAVPPPPPNPSEDELQASRDKAEAQASKVGVLANDLADAEGQLQQLKAEVGRKLELVKKAMIDLRRARDAAERAEREAQQAKEAVRAASDRIAQAREKLDEFVAGSYQQGSVVGSVSAYFGSDNAAELLERAQLLDSIADSRLSSLENMRRAQTVKANKESAARAALREARQKREAAERAKQQADAAKQAAIEAREKQAARIAELEDKKDRIQHQLYQARQQVDSLENQQEAYEDWLARKRAAERRRQQAALAAASSNSGGNSGDNSAASSGASASVTSSAPSASALIEQVIARAKSQLGVPYAWGGGNASGPTYGIRDGGVADAHGDWKKIGFDCSGLMTYAFAPVKIIPSYSGYQYDAGRKVPVSQAQRGDMLFWGPGGNTHVALYLGNGMMIEAPFSGGHVRIAPVRWAGIAPYAVRIIG